MKIKSFITGALSFGLAAGVLRTIQYLTVIDSDGFFKKDNLTVLLNGCLIGLLGIGLIWSLLSGLKQKAQAPFADLYPRGLSDLLFFGLAAVAAFEGIYRLYTLLRTPPINGIELLVSILCLLGALGWVSLSKRSATLLAIFPILHLSASIIDYFWATYQYIHISGYVLMVLGLCTLVLFTTMLMKAASGATCSRGRMVGFSTLAISMIPATFIEPFFNPTLPNIILALQGGLTFFLALLTLIQLSKPAPTPKSAPTTEPNQPDLAALNQYFAEIMEEDEDNESD